MPQILFKGCSETLVKKWSKTLLIPLSEAIGCSKDLFNFIHIKSDIFLNGEDISDKILIIEIKWGERDSKIKGFVANIITEEVSKDCEKEIKITFFDLNDEDYYKNGIAVNKH